MPEHYPTDPDSLERDCDLEFFIGRGPGGQHRNKVESGVRLTHRATNIVVTATERRSQHENRAVAFERMAERLQALQRVRKHRRTTRPSSANREQRLSEKHLRGQKKEQRTAPVREE